MSNDRHVSVREIAARAGVSHATVSLALRGSPRLAAATRERVRAVAEEMGWRPNPAVAAWMAHRRSISPVEGREGIVFLNSWPDPEEWRSSPWMTRYVEGARERAAELGYGFDEIHCTEMAAGSRRLQKVLEARGIRGVIVGSLHETSREPDLDWSRIAAVGQSYTFSALGISRSLNNYFQSMRTAMIELRALGYRRIGYARSPELEERTSHANASAYLGCEALLPPAERVEFLDWTRPDAGVLKAWLERERPDALLSHDVYLEEILAGIGVRVPDDLGLAVLCLHPGWGPEGLAGIDQRLERCGRMAIELLASRLAQNELGLPDVPVLALTAGMWVPGRTVRDVR